MTNYRTFDEVSEEYFLENPEEIDAFLAEIFDAFSQGSDSAALLSQLRVIARVKGVSAMANEIGITRQGLQKALSSKGNPRLENVNAIMQAMGYRLTPQRLELC